jgi:hypothetical protein
MNRGGYSGLKAGPVKAVDLGFGGGVYENPRSKVGGGMGGGASGAGYGKYQNGNYENSETNTISTKSSL